MEGNDVLFRKDFIGVAKVEKTVVDIARSLAEANITPQDLANPVSFQIAFSRLYDAILKSIEQGGKVSYVAEVRFKDSLGNVITFAVDLGERPPPLSSNVVKARITVELLEGE